MGQGIKNLNMPVFLKILIYAVLVVISLDALTLYLNSHPPKYRLNIPPSRFGVKYEDISFRATDGISLKGWFIKGKGDGRLPALIICHGLGANRSDFTELAAGLSSKGYSVLLFDFRGHGESDRAGSSFGHLERNDLIGAIEYIKHRGDVDGGRIAVYGFSMGGAVTILTASKNQDIRAVISDSSYASLREQGRRLFNDSPLPASIFFPPLLWMYELLYRVDTDEISPVAAVEIISPRRIMIIGGGADEQIPSSDAMRIFTAAKEPKELWLIPGAVHGGTVYMAGEEYTKRLLSFLDASLKKD